MNVAGESLSTGSATPEGSVIFDEQFSSTTTLDPAWTFTQRSGRGRYSLTDNPGWFRYYGEGYQTWQALTWWDPTLNPPWPESSYLSRPFAGDHWTLRSSAAYHLHGTNNGGSLGAQDANFVIAFGEGKGPLLWISRCVDKANNFDALQIYIQNADGGTPMRFPDMASLETTFNFKAPDDVYHVEGAEGWIHHTYWYEVVRDGQQVTVKVSSDGTTFVTARSFTLPPTTTPAQRLAVYQLQYTPQGSYTDWDFITVNAPVPAPVAHDDTYTTAEDQPLTVPVTTGVLANDASVGTSPRAAAATQPAHGSLALNEDGSFTYTPTANYHGTDTFTYTVTAGTQTSAPATVTITVTEALVEPEPSGTVTPGSSVIFDEQFSSTTTLDPAWSFTQRYGRGRYSLTDNPGWFRYYGEGSRTTHALSWWDPTFASINPTWPESSYLYRAYAGDHWVFRTSATYHLHGTTNGGSTGGIGPNLVFAFGDGMGPLLRIERAVDKAYELNALYMTLQSEGRGGTLRFPDELAGTPIDFKAPDDVYHIIGNEGWIIHTYWYEVARDGQQVTVKISTDGTNFVPARSFTLPSTVAATQRIAIYQGQWAETGSYTDWDFITARTLAAPEPVPVAHDDVYTTDEDQAITRSAAGGVLANDESLGTSPRATAVTQPAHGSLALSEDGSFTYTPVANYHGTDTFTYTVTVGTQTSNTATVTITVSDVNDLPAAAFTFLPPAPTTADSVTFTDGSSDPDGTVTGWAWDFGDGATATTQNPTHTYATKGTYTVALTVTDNSGGRSSHTTQVIITEPLPIPITGPMRITKPGTYILQTDLLNRNDMYCIEILSSDVVLEGNDHTIDAQGQSPSAGIMIGQYSGSSYSNVVVRNLVLSDWGMGIQARDTSRVTIENVDCTNDGVGVYLWNAASTTVTASDFACRYKGVEGQNGADTVVDRCTFTSSGYAVEFEGTARPVVRDSQITGGTYGLLVNGVSSAPSGATFSGNTISGATYGIYANYFAGAQITGNTVTNNREGIRIGSFTGSTITGNTVTGNAQNGLSLSGCTGNTIANNYFENPLNVQHYTGGANTWALSGQAGTNIIGGLRLGGNFWGAPDSTGFSNTAVDLNSDGFADSPYATQYFTDPLPLVPVGQRPKVPPVASFTATPTSGVAPLAVQFTDTSTGPVTARTWDFGDGTTASAEQNPEHTFASAGTYTVSLTLTNQDGTDTGSVEITVADPVPVAAFTATPTQGTVPLSVTFTDQSQNAPTEWRWDFETDGIVDSTAQNPTHTYTGAGTFTVTLTVTSAAGSDSETSTVTVNLPPAPTADAGGPYTGVEGSAVTLSAAGSAGTGIASYDWDFNGDGTYDRTTSTATTEYTWPDDVDGMVGVRVTDAYGQQAVATAQTSIANAPPVVEAGPELSATAGIPVTFAGTFTDAGAADTHTFAWSFDDGSSSVEQNPAHAFATAGTHTATLTVTDDDLGSGSDTVTVTVSYPVPVANDDTYTTSEDTVLTVSAPGVLEGDGGIIAITTAAVATGPSHGVLALDSDGRFTYTPTANYHGSDAFTYTARTGTQTSAPATVTITVSAVDDAPVLNPLTPQTIAEGESLTVAINAVDPDGDAVTYGASSLPAGASFTASSGIFIWTPGFDQAGSYDVTFTATAGGVSVSQTVTITATPVDRAPDLNAIPQELQVNEGVSLEFQVRAADPDGEPVTYSVSGLPETTVDPLDPATGLFSWAPGYDRAGSYDVTFTATAGGLSDSETVKITVTNVNRAPMAYAGEPQLLEAPGTLVTLDGSGSCDEDGDSLTYAWSFDRVPSGSAASLNTAIPAAPTFTADRAGEYVVRLVVSDGALSSEPDTVTLSFANLRPEANAGPSQSAVLGETVSLDGSSSSDPNEGQTSFLSYQWSIASAPAGSTAVIGAPTAKSTAFVPDKVGTYTIQLVVNDGLLNSEVSTCSVEVIARETKIIADIQVVEDAIAGIDAAVALKNPTMQNTLINKLNAVIAAVATGDYQDASNKLKNDILAKTDGCMLSGAPDKNDWITDCGTQRVLYGQIVAIIDELQAV